MISNSFTPFIVVRPCADEIFSSLQTHRLMARRNTWSSRQPTIRELPDDEAAELLTSDDIRKSIVLSMKADDEDWSNYRRRSSGGTAVQVFNQSRSRSSSRVGECKNHIQCI